MSTLDLSPHFQDGDAFYAALVDALDAAGPDGGVRLLARLCLILANQVGDHTVLAAALARAVDTAPTGDPPASRTPNSPDPYSSQPGG